MELARELFKIWGYRRFDEVGCKETVEGLGLRLKRNWDAW